MRWLLALVGLAALGPSRVCAEERSSPWNPATALNLRVVGKSVRELVAGAGKFEIVEMFTAITNGSQMGAGDGWFHPGKSRYGWQWLAERFDTNKDGKITREEFRGPAELFDRLDRNHDGVLTADDFDWSERGLRSLQNPAATMLFYLLDTDSNGRISKKEWDAFFARAAKGKDHLTREDVREAVEQLRAAVAKAQSKDGPSPAIFVKGLLEGELGSFYEGPRVGKPAPDFALKTHDGKRTIRLSEFRGKKPVVLVFGSFT
jgi:Ca2+-binding EF-hand superfamily protein